MTREIPLTRGLVALVDDEDYELVSQSRWYAQRATSPNGQSYGFYARRTRVGVERLMHRLIANAPDGVPVDHINRDKLDNRRSNLRLATASLNAVNRQRPNKTTGYRGVQCAGDKFRAVIRVGGRSFSLGRFATAVEAARAYDAKALDVHGAFAVLNFPAEPQETV